MACRCDRAKIEAVKTLITSLIILYAHSSLIE